MAIMPSKIFVHLFWPRRFFFFEKQPEEWRNFVFLLDHQPTSIAHLIHEYGVSQVLIPAARHQPTNELVSLSTGACAPAGQLMSHDSWVCCMLPSSFPLLFFLLKGFPLFLRAAGTILGAPKTAANLENILGANHYLRTNHANFNLSISIQGCVQESGGGICKTVIN